MKPKYYDGFCDPECPFLVTPILEDGSFNYNGCFKCNKYNEELSYYDWVLQSQTCYKEHVDPEWVITGEDDE